MAGTTLLDVFDRPASVRIRGRTIAVPALTLGALCDLQAFARDHSWDPWDVPEVDRPDLMLATVIVEADGWPPALGSELAGLAIASGAYQDEFAYVAFGRSNGLDRAGAADLGVSAREDVVPWQRVLGAAYGEHPADAASRVLNAIEEALPPEDAGPVDWPLAVAELVLGGEGRRGMGFAEAEALTLPQFRLLRRFYRDREGRGRLAAGPACPPRPRAGETARDAERRRQALCEEARAVLEARYATTGASAASANGARAGPSA